MLLGHVGRHVGKLMFEGPDLVDELSDHFDANGLLAAETVRAVQRVEPGIGQR